MTSVDTASEALAVSIGERAKVDLPFMAELSGKTEEQITEELAGAIFRNPLTDKWETSDEYLSGNVREKLGIAERFAENHPEYEGNVQYLKKVQPKDLDASEIEVRLGATWVDTEYITQFMGETFHTPGYYLGSKIDVRYAAVNGQWNITGKNMDNRGNALVQSTYGTQRANAYRLLEDALNLRDTKIYDTIEDADGEHRVLNKKETMLAQQKQEMIKEAFKEWIFRDIDRREALCKKYNELFSTVDEALFYQVPRKHIRTIKEEKILKNVNKFGKTETKTVGGLRKNKSSRESAGVGIFAGVFEKAVGMACDCLKGLIKIFRGAIAPKPPQPVKEYKQYAKMVDELLENHRALNRVHMAIREAKDQMDRKEYRMFGGKKKLKDEIVQLEKQEKKARSLESRLLKKLNGDSVDEVIRKFNRMRMEMDAYKNSVDRAENAKEMLDENVREYMGNVQEKVSAREKSRDGRGEKKMEFRR